jgi:predicted ribosomally synthesized peptide with nif11-like leader
MSEEQLKAFLEKVKGDTNLQEKLKAVVSTDELVALAKDAGFIIAAENINAESLKVKLSDEELEGVAGGWGNCSNGYMPCGGTTSCIEN